MASRDTQHGVDIVAVHAAELRVGDLIGPGCEVVEVRRVKPLRLLVRTSTGHSDSVAPGRSYWVAADRPEGPPALAPEEPEAPAAEEPETPWYCALCDTVVTEPGHRNSVACAVGQDAIAHPYDPNHSNTNA